LFGQWRGSGSKLKVLYCDDNSRSISEFAERHHAHYDVVPSAGIDDVHGEIARLDAEHSRPDLLLLDLYHPHGVDDDALTLKAREQAEAMLDQLSTLIDEVRPYVNRAWTPSAIGVLETLRRDFPEHRLPVLIYTRRGLLLLQDQEIRRISEHSADWLLKEPKRISVDTERELIDRYVRQANAARRLPRDLRLTVCSVIASAVISVVVTLLAT
jgi:hypothetical protein